MKQIIFNIILVALLIIAGMGWYNSAMENKDLQDIIEKPIASTVPLEAEIIARVVDSLGLEHAIAEDSKPIVKKIELLVEDRRKVDSLQRLNDIKDNRLMSYTQTTASLQQDNIHLRRELNQATQDTIYKYQDKWLTLGFQRQNDSLAIGSFRYDFDFETMQYWDRDWFLGRKKSYTNIWSKDPRVTIRGFERLTIENPEPAYGLRVQANANWNPETGSIGYGPGLRVDVDRFSFQGNYTYYPESGRWRPMISGNFDLIRF